MRIMTNIFMRKSGRSNLIPDLEERDSKKYEKKGDLQKKKKRSTPDWPRDFCSLRPENDTKRAAKLVMTFFFFGDHPFFLSFYRLVLL